MRRRDFLSFAGLACAGFALNPERLLWTPLRRGLHVYVEPEDFISSGTVKLYGSHDNENWTELVMLPVESERDGAGVIYLPPVRHPFVRVEDSPYRFNAFMSYGARVVKAKWV